MGNLSTYRSNGVPVGSVVMMHKQLSQSLVVDNGAEYLRTGEYVPYQTKYATAAARGFFSVSGGNIFNTGNSSQASLGYGNSPTRMPSNYRIMAYAKGGLGYLTTDEDLVSTRGVDTTYYFKQVDSGSQLETPIIVRTPKYADVGLDGGFELLPWYARVMSAPAWSAYSNKWFCAVASNNGTFPNSTTVTVRESRASIHLLSSIDGVSWTNVGLVHSQHVCIVNSTGGGPNAINSLAICPLGNTIHLFEYMLVGIAPSLASYATLVEIDTNGNLEGLVGLPAGIILSAPASNSWLGYNLVAAPLSPVSGYLHYPNTGSANAVSNLAFLDTTGTYNSGAQTGNYSLNATTLNFASGNCGFYQLATNGTTVVGYNNSGTSQTLFRIEDVTNVRTASVSTNSYTTAAGTSVGPFIGWSGQNYLAMIGDSSVGTTSLQYRIAPAASSAPTALTNLNGWTDAALYYQTQVGEGTLYKNHILYLNSSTNWVAGNIASNVTTDFTAVAAGAGRVPPRWINSVIAADGTNVLIARGCDNSVMPATISKYDLANPNTAPDLKYLGTSSCPVTLFGEFKRLSDPSNTIVHVPRTGSINKLLYSTNNGDTWAEATVTAVTNVRDVDYIAGRFVVVGTTNTTNYAHATALNGTWTAGTINSSATNVLKVYNTGSALIAVNSAGNPYRSTTGTAWTVCSGTAVTGESTYAKIGTTHYLFTNASTARISRHQSTDDGVTWSAATTLSLVVSSGQIPYKIISFNGKFYFTLGVPNTAITSADIFETTDFTTISETPRAHAVEALTYFPGPVAVGSSLYHILTAYDAQSQPGTSTTNGLVISKLASSASTPSFIGSSEGVVQGNMIGYVRIK